MPFHRNELFVATEAGGAIQFLDHLRVDPDIRLQVLVRYQKHVLRRQRQSDFNVALGKARTPIRRGSVWSLGLNKRHGTSEVIKPVASSVTKTLILI